MPPIWQVNTRMWHYGFSSALGIPYPYYNVLFLATCALQIEPLCINACKKQNFLDMLWSWAILFQAWEAVWPPEVGAGWTLPTAPVIEDFNSRNTVMSKDLMFYCPNVYLSALFLPIGSTS